jgi:uncharacterized membrane protein
MGPKEGAQPSTGAMVTLIAVGAPLSMLTTSCGVPPGGPFWGFGPPFDQLFGVLIAGGLVVLGVYAWQKFQSSRAGSAGGTPSSAEEIARQRYARGELSRDEFFRILTDLKTPGRERP